MYHDYTEEELRSYCRTCLESLETWARRLIHEKMTQKYGTSYINAKKENGEYIIKNAVRQHIQSMQKKEPDRFHQPVDTLFIDHIIYFLCNQNWYKNLFKEALDHMYPEGHAELRTFLTRLVPIRNALSHGNPISTRQAEQAICYSHDFVEGLKKYYKEKGLEQVWNVPRIIRITDSLGNVFNNPVDGLIGWSIFQTKAKFHCGDSYSVNIEVDSSFAESEYNISWSIDGKNVPEFNDSKKFIITFSEANIAASVFLQCRIISKKSWHKYSGYDCAVTLKMSVLPPME